MQRGLLALVIGVLCAVLPAQAQEPDSGPDAGPGTATFPRTQTDASGADVTVRAYPQQVALLGEYAPLALIVPPAAQIALAPSTDPAQIDWSEIGLLVMPQVYAAAYPALLTAAQAASVPVFQVTLPGGVRAWHTTLTALGTITGREWRAARHLHRLARAATTARHRAAGQVPRRILVITPEAYTYGQQTLLSDLIALSGGTNAAAQAGYADFRQLDDATIRALRPDIILLTPGWTDAAQASFAANPTYADVPAIAQGRVYRLPFAPTLPADPARAVQWLATHFFPAPLPFPPG